MNSSYRDLTQFAEIINFVPFKLDETLWNSRWNRKHTEITFGKDNMGKRQVVFKSSSSKFRECRKRSWEVSLNITLRHIICKVRAISSCQMDCFFTRCLPIAFTMCFHVSEREIIFWPKCSKFAVEWDWNSQDFSKRSTFGFFLEK